MNQLNSIILEGSVAADKQFVEAENSFLKFPLQVVRNSKLADGTSLKEVSTFNVEAYGRMAEVCNLNCNEGTEIRVVGRLKEKNGNVSVVAEHIEIKPSFGKKY